MTEPTEITGCSDCPFKAAATETTDYDAIATCGEAFSFACKLTGGWIDGMLVGTTPDWCPLREEPVTVQLKSASCPEVGSDDEPQRLAKEAREIREDFQARLEDMWNVSPEERRKPTG